jgi:hypothetical protein
MPCIITGCWLVDPQQERRVWGDLHTLGDSYIFVAVGEVGKGPGWIHSGDIAPNEVGLELILSENLPNSAYFERERLILVSKAWAKLNEVAREYVGEQT